MLMPYLCALTLSCIQMEKLIFLPLIIFLLLNYRDLLQLKEIAIKLIKKPEVIDV